MSHISAEALRCDICGHTWLSEKKNPSHCAKCKSRRWNCKEDAMYKALRKEAITSSKR